MTKPNADKRDLIVRTKNAALARQKARYAELVALIRRRMTEVVEGFYDIGEALREILEKKLYAAEGHASMAAFLSAERLFSYRQANKLIAIVRKVPREQALSLGQERAFALVAYTEATPEDDSPASLVAQAAKIGAKPVTEASVREISDATRALRDSERAKRPRTDAQRARAKSDAAIEKAVKAALRAGGIARAEVTVTGARIRIELTRAQGEKLAGID
jgi:hypothetical protein